MTVKALGNRTILDDFSVPLDRGDILFLVGESGSGKTTFIRLCLGILPSAFTVQRGKLEYFKPDGEPEAAIEGSVLHWDVFRRYAGTVLGYCPQDPFSRFNSRKPLAHQLWISSLAERWRWFPEWKSFGYFGIPTLNALLSAALYVAPLFGGKKRRDVERDALEVELGARLTEAGLRLEDLESLPRQRSYGYIQRLGLTQVPQDLSILFLDEPFNAVDLVTRERLIEYCVGLLSSERVGAMVCATHDHQLIESFVAAAHGTELRCAYQDITDGEGYRTLDHPYVRPDMVKLTPPQVDLEPDREPERLEEDPKDEIPSRLHIGPLESPGRVLNLIFDREDLHYSPGEIIGIVGSSNSGKTTLGRHLCGWDTRRGIGNDRQYVPQDPFSCFSPGLPVGECCPGLGDALKELLSERAGELEPLLDRPPGNLSGGQLQRLRILAAMAREPELLFLDEPFAHQDPEWVKSLAKLIRDVTDKSVESGGSVGTSMIVSHDVELLLGFCNRIILLIEFYLRVPRGALVLTLPFIDASLGKPGGGTFVDQLDQQLEAGGLQERLRQALLSLGLKRLGSEDEEAKARRAQAVGEAKPHLEDLVELLRGDDAAAA